MTVQELLDKIKAKDPQIIGCINLTLCSYVCFLKLVSLTTGNLMLFGAQLPGRTFMHRQQPYYSYNRIIIGCHGPCCKCLYRNTSLLELPGEEAGGTGEDGGALL